ncbi:YfjI family protein [uncultured Piscinibacter sp.]|uniref:YfjI family protein n=1 Tax=uncultured Piscinibacter sp. TaxID=1131835 RepID=UPI0026368DA8|nr:YfjI family protein [uncultured Piscinibacter sp.]
MSAVPNFRRIEASAAKIDEEIKNEDSAWPQPEEIKAELLAAPNFDAAALLPQTLAEFVLDEADRMPCSPDYIAAAIVVALGSVIGAKCAIKPKRRDDWIVTPNLFGGVVGDPSAKKTPAINTVMRFLDRLEAAESEKHAEAVRVHEAEVAAFEARRAALKASMKKAASGKGDSLKMDAAVADLQDLHAPEEPHERRFKSNDATVEKLGDLLTHNPAGMFVFRDELVGLLSSWEREGREGDRAFYLEGWNGTGSFNIDRIGRGSLHVKSLCLSVFGGIQPDLLSKYLSGIASSLDNDGRIQRFQVLVYPDAVKWEWRDRYPVKGAREAVRDIFDRMAAFDPVQDGAAPADDFVKLPHFYFDDAAQEVFIEWSGELHRQRIATETNPLMQQHFGKYEKLFCALALILHLAEGRIGPVQADSAIRAAAWCQYLEGHARRIYGLIEAARVSAAAMVGRRLAEGKLQDGFTARDVVRKGWTGIGTTLQAETALATLEERGWIQSADIEDQPGRPTTRYYINPRIRRAAS